MCNCKGSGHVGTEADNGDFLSEMRFKKKKKKKTGIKKTQRADKGNVKVFHRGLKSQCSSAPLAEGAAFLTPHLRLCFLLKLVYSLSH